MRCIQCGSHKDKVVDSRMSKDGTTIRRRRECLDCSYRYTTYEQIERTELRVVKKDGSREATAASKPGARLGGVSGVATGGRRADI